jgi:3-phenylpropionate/cinnamic acid dioxygenase small subunit
VRNPNDENGQGMLAARLALVRFGTAQKAAANPAKQAMLAKKDDLEARVDRLKLEKAAMPVEVYRKQLSMLLLELARLQEELDK